MKAPHCYGACSIHDQDTFSYSLSTTRTWKFSTLG